MVRSTAVIDKHQQGNPSTLVPESQPSTIKLRRRLGAQEPSASSNDLVIGGRRRCGLGFPAASVVLNAPQRNPTLASGRTVQGYAEETWGRCLLWELFSFDLGWPRWHLCLSSFHQSAGEALGGGLGARVLAELLQLLRSTRLGSLACVARDGGVRFSNTGIHSEHQQVFTTSETHM